MMFEFRQITKIVEDQLTQILIDPDSVVQSQIDPSSLICSICHHIVWNPLMCSIKNGCHTYFCTSCINSWIASVKTKVQQSDKIKDIPCPNCKQKLVTSTPPPVLKCLLNNLKLNCLFGKNGCQQLVKYSNIQQHSLKQCPYRNIQCQGCYNSVLFKDIQSHTQNCQLFIIECCQCQQLMSKRHYRKSRLQHDFPQDKTQIQVEKDLKIEKARSVECYSYEIANYHKSIQKVQTKVDSLNQRYETLETITQTFIKGESFKLAINFHTGFTDYFQFPQPTLIKSSFNPLKNRNDFLHFYISTPIHLNSIVGIEWTLTIEKMKGNLLLGFCSSIGGESLDLIVNKYGEIKKKDFGQNKYKLIKKAQNFMFGQKDVISFAYEGRKKALKIANRTRKVSIELGKDCMYLFCQSKSLVKQTQKNCMYAFYSMDTVGDKLSFLKK